MTLDHPGSYYAATAHWRTDYPQLQGTREADVCIIGGGFTGLSTAIELTRRGYSVVLLEAHHIGWGASGRNGGQMIGGFADAGKVARRLGEAAGEMVWEMGLRCTQIVRERIDEFDIQCDFKEGYFDAAVNNRQMDALLDWTRERLERGYPHALEVVERRDLRSVVGSERYVGGVLDAGNGHLHPLNLCLGEAKAAERLGVRIFERSAVSRVIPGPRPRAVTGGGEVDARYVVVAGNAYLGSLIGKLNGRVLPAGSYIIATEPLDEALAHELLPRDSAVCDQNVVLDYFRLSADRRLLFGGMCNYSGREPKSITATLRPKMLRVFPQLKDTSIEYEWGGHIGISINRIPQLGRLSGNVLYAIGYSGHGVAASHMSGVILADAIAGNAEKLDVFDRIHHWKLPGGRWFASPALALGMLYFRLKDLL